MIINGSVFLTTDDWDQASVSFLDGFGADGTKRGKLRRYGFDSSHSVDSPCFFIDLVGTFLGGDQSFK